MAGNTKTRKVVSGDYCQAAVFQLSTLVADSPVFKKLEVMAASLLGTSKYGVIIKQLEYYFSNVIIAAASCDLSMALALADLDDELSPTLLSDGRLVDLCQIRHGFHVGTPADQADSTVMPVIHKFTDLPGGGLLVPADYIYGAIDSTVRTAVISGTLRMWYEVIELSPTDYLDLLQSRNILTA